MAVVLGLCFVGPFADGANCCRASSVVLVLAVAGKGRSEDANFLSW